MRVRSAFGWPRTGLCGLAGLACGMFIAAALCAPATVLAQDLDAEAAGEKAEAAPAAPAAEATEFNVILEGADPAKKINVIKAVRELTGQGLAEAKATVEGGAKAIKEGVDKKTAEDVKKKLEEAGGKVSIKPV